MLLQELEKDIYFRWLLKRNEISPVVEKLASPAENNGFWILLGTPTGCTV